jgi:hypothetical protein
VFEDSEKFLCFVFVCKQLILRGKFKSNKFVAIFLVSVYFDFRTIFAEEMMTICIYMDIFHSDASGQCVFKHCCSLYSRVKMVSRESDTEEDHPGRTLVHTSLTVFVWKPCSHSRSGWSHKMAFSHKT